VEEEPSVAQREELSKRNICGEKMEEDKRTRKIRQRKKMEEDKTTMGMRS
jgi:hypothetical protein